MVSSRALSFTLTLLSVCGSSLSFGGTPAPPATPVIPKLSPEARADILMARKMYREAIDVYALEPETSAARWNKTGIAFHQLMNLNEARRDYEHALRINPEFGEARNNLGTVYYSEKSYRRAIREYKKALRVMPDSASIYSNMGTAYFARKDYKRAADDYQKALELDPDVFEHHNSYGVLMQEHSVEERAKYYYYLSKMYAKNGNTERAIQYARKALEAGFDERKKFLDDPEFTALRNNADFQQVIKSEPRVL